MKETQEGCLSREVKPNFELFSKFKICGSLSKKLFRQAGEVFAPVKLSKDPVGVFRQGDAAHRMHNLAEDQISHLRAEMDFCPGTRPGQKWISFYSCLRARALQGFLDLPQKEKAL